MIYSAKDLTPKYKIQLPKRVPYGLHGIHLTEEQLSAARKKAGWHSAFRRNEIAQQAMMRVGDVLGQLETLKGMVWALSATSSTG
jgi:hypothetical protein